MDALLLMASRVRAISRIRYPGRALVPSTGWKTPGGRPGGDRRRRCAGREGGRGARGEGTRRRQRPSKQAAYAGSRCARSLLEIAAAALPSVRCICRCCRTSTCRKKSVGWSSSRTRADSASRRHEQQQRRPCRDRRGRPRGVGADGARAPSQAVRHCGRTAAATGNPVSGLTSRQVPWADLSGYSIAQFRALLADESATMDQFRSLCFWGVPDAEGLRAAYWKVRRRPLERAAIPWTPVAR